MDFEGYAIKYYKNVNSIGNAVRDQLPDYWFANKASVRVAETIKSWEFISEYLPSTYSFLVDYLVDVHPLMLNGRNALLYHFRIEEDDIVYAGEVPLGSSISATLAEKYSSLPLAVGKFYTDLHNGWYFLPAMSMGFLPLADCFFLSEKEWGILGDIDISGLKLEEELCISTNGGCGYLCIKGGSSAPTEFLEWWSNDRPRVGLNFWEKLDSWISIAFD